MTSFYKYIIKYKYHYNRYGDFARDAIQDKSFPKRIQYKQDEYAVIKRYLESKDAHPNAISTFVDAYHDYLRDVIKK